MRACTPFAGRGSRSLLPASLSLNQHHRQPCQRPRNPPLSPVADQSPATQPTSHLAKVTVTALDQARYEIAPPFGAQTYTLTPTQIQDTPEGDNATFQEVLLRAPGVVPDSFGQEHVRGEHGNLTYRVNGVLLPEPLNGFGQELDTHLIDSVTLIDGTLPAQFGFHTAGIVDVQTKSGDTLDHNQILRLWRKLRYPQPLATTGRNQRQTRLLHHYLLQPQRPGNRKPHLQSSAAP